MHVLGEHVHCIIHSGIVMSWGWLCQLLAFTRVYHLVCLLDWNMWAIWYIALLCRAICRSFMCGWMQVESRCGHVSLS